MGKSIKSGYHQKIIQKGSWMERLPRAMYSQKRSQMERVPRATYLQKETEGPRWDWVSPDTAGFYYQERAALDLDNSPHSRQHFGQE